MSNNKQAWNQIQENQRKSGNHQQHPPKPKGEQQKENKRPNFFVYNARIAMRFYSKLIQEAALALMLVLPLWGYFKLQGIDSIMLPTDLPTLLGIAFLLFLVQSFMFQKG